MATKHGYFLIADITGYTQYLSASELEHAEKILTALLNTLIQHTKPPLVISRLAGDAVISYGLGERFVSGQTFIEMLEDTYVSFRRQIELMVHNTSCPCNACRNIGSLDLKFFVHYGEFSVQKLDAHEELVGSDVNLLHRLLKNSVTEATGLRAYTLFTEAAVKQLALGEAAEAFALHEESYEHLGTVRMRVEDMHPVWEERRESVQVRVDPKDELYRLEADVDVPPEAVWDFVVDAGHFNVLLGGDRSELKDRRRGRVATGSAYQCYHGDQAITNTVVGWRPFEQVVVEYVLPLPMAKVTGLVELQLHPTETGTHFIEIISKSRGPAVGRIAGDAGLRMRQARFQELLEGFANHVNEQVAARGPLPVPAAVAAEAIGAAARESLAIQ